MFRPGRSISLRSGRLRREDGEHLAGFRSAEAIENLQTADVLADDSLTSFNASPPSSISPNALHRNTERDPNRFHNLCITAREARERCASSGEGNIEFLIVAAISEFRERWMDGILF